MSSPPSEKDNNDQTVLHPLTPQHAPSSAPAPPSPASPPAAEVSGRRGDSGSDPHSPTLSAASIASGVQVEGNALPIGTYLGEFELNQVVGEGGFGIVYLAIDHSLQRRVALKEYMPSSLAERTSGMQVSSLSADDEETFRKGLDSFINEARLLAQFDHPSLVKVHRFWEANGTAYMVMPFYEGPTLKETLRDMQGPPDEAWLLGLLDPLTRALAVLHAAQCYHRDIAPDNILLLAGSGRPLLLDFGAARRVIGDASQALTVILKPGYAPLEQYAEIPGMQQGPWTDVYALAAVLYFAITGKKPPAAVGRLLNDQYIPLQKAVAADGRYSANFMLAIDRALAVKPADRTQDIDVFRAELGFDALPRDAAGGLVAGAAAPSLYAPERSGQTANAGADRTNTSASASTSSGSNGKLIGVAVAVAGLVLAGGGWWWLNRPAEPPPAVVSQAKPPSDPQIAATPAPAPAPAPVVPVAAPPAPFSVVGEFKRIVNEQTPGFSVEARLTKTKLRIDKDKLFVTVNSSRDGYFYVLSHAPDGQLILFFPNQQVPTNKILAGESITLPRDKKDPKTGKLPDDIILTEPPGQAQLFVVVSKNPRDFSALGDKRVSYWSEFPTGAAAESLANSQVGKSSIYLGKPVCPSTEPCTDEYGASLVEFEVTR